MGYNNPFLPTSFQIPKIEIPKAPIVTMSPYQVSEMQKKAVAEATPTPTNGPVGADTGGAVPSPAQITDAERKAELDRIAQEEKDRKAAADAQAKADAQIEANKAAEAAAAKKQADEIAAQKAANEAMLKQGRTDIDSFLAAENLRQEGLASTNAYQQQKLEEMLGKGYTGITDFQTAEAARQAQLVAQAQARQAAQSGQSAADRTGIETERASDKKRFSEQRSKLDEYIAQAKGFGTTYDTDLASALSGGPAASMARESQAVRRQAEEMAKAETDEAIRASIKAGRTSGMLPGQAALAALQASGGQYRTALGASRASAEQSYRAQLEAIRQAATEMSGRQQAGLSQLSGLAGMESDAVARSLGLGLQVSQADQAARQAEAQNALAASGQALNAGQSVMGQQAQLAQTGASGYQNISQNALSRAGLAQGAGQSALGQQLALAQLGQVGGQQGVQNALALMGYSQAGGQTSVQQLLASGQLAQNGALNYAQMSQNAQLQREDIVAKLQMLKQQLDAQGKTQESQNTTNLINQIIAGGASLAGALVLSDRNAKTDIKSTSFLDKIERVKGKSYRYKGSARPEAGLIAQDLEKTAMAPAVVNNGGVKMIDSGRLSTMNTAAISELNSKVRELVAELGKIQKPTEAK